MCVLVLVCCLSVCPAAYVSPKPHVLISQHFLLMLPVAVARSSSDDNEIRCVLPVLWMTSRCHVMEQIGRTQNECICFVKCAWWRHRGRSLPSSTVYCFKCSWPVICWPRIGKVIATFIICLLYTSPSPRDGLLSRMPSSA